jgi:hypothetical protein
LLVGEEVEGNELEIPLGLDGTVERTVGTSPPTAEAIPDSGAFLVGIMPGSTARLLEEELINEGLPGFVEDPRLDCFER